MRPSNAPASWVWSSGKTESGMHEKRGYLISIICVALFFGIASAGEAVFGSPLTTILLWIVGITGCLAQLDAMQILNLDSLFEAIKRLVQRPR